VLRCTAQSVMLFAGSFASVRKATVSFSPFRSFNRSLHYLIHSLNQLQYTRFLRLCSPALASGCVQRFCWTQTHPYTWLTHRANEPCPAKPFPCVNLCIRASCSRFTPALKRSQLHSLRCTPFITFLTASN